MSKFTLYTTVGRTIVNCRKNREIGSVVGQAWPDLLKALKEQKTPLMVYVEEDHFAYLVQSLEHHTKTQWNYRTDGKRINITINGTVEGYYKPVMTIVPGQKPEEIKPEETKVEEVKP